MLNEATWNSLLSILLSYSKIEILAFFLEIKLQESRWIHERKSCACREVSVQG